MRKTLAIGDLHLTRDTPRPVKDHLVSLIRESRGTRIAFAGDLFDLSADFPGSSSGSSIARALEAQPEIVAALGEHVEKGGELWLVSGNHDAAVGEPENLPAIQGALGLSGPARDRVKTSPWYLRDGGLHFEHGHLYDPDNAPSHPLVPRVRSLGVHFVEEFIAPTGAFRYLHANDQTPLKLFLSAFTWYGKRGPFVVYKYFRAAFLAFAKCGPFFDGSDQVREGLAAEERFLREHGGSPEMVRALREIGREPTMASFARTFHRLYFDRVLATVSLASGAALLLARQRKAALLAVSAGALALGTSWSKGHDRFGGTVPELLRIAGQAVREATQADLVVFGHAHKEALEDGYANTASFSFPGSLPGRPYLELEERSGKIVATRQYLVREKQDG